MSLAFIAVLLLAPAPPNQAVARCTPAQVRTLFADGIVARVQSSCAKLALRSGLPLTSGRLSELCAHGLADLCALGADKQPGVLAAWLTEAKEAELFAQAWLLRADQCTDYLKSRPWMTAYCANGLTRATAWSQHRADAIMSYEPGDMPGTADLPTRKAFATQKIQQAQADAKAAGFRSAELVSTSTSTAWVADVALGLADFVTARLKAEMDAFVLNRLTKVMCVEASIWAVTNTCRLLVTDEGSLLSPSFGASFQAAIKSDILGLPQAAADRPETKTLKAKLTLTLVSALMNNTPYRITVRRLAAVAAKHSEPAARAAQTALATLEAAELCLGQGHKAPTCIEQSELAFRALSGHAPNASQKLELADIVRAIADLREAANRLSSLWRLSDSDAKKTPANNGETPATPAPHDPRELEHLRLTVWRAVLQSFGAAARLSDGAWSVPTEMPRLLLALEKGSLPEVLLILIGELARANAQPATKAIRLLAFGADLTAASSAEEARQTIDAFAAPVGASRLKYGQTFTASVGALAGIGAGFEWINGGAVMSSNAGFNYGLMAPIGIDVAWGLGDCYTMGLFFSLLDVGALLNLRASDSTEVEATQSDSEGSATQDATVNKTPDFDLRQVLAPGLLVRIGINKSPFTVGAGLTVAPYARDVLVADGTKADDTTALRALLMLGFDIPIIYF
jgi:hypothetical protein